jgi:hypothetical protein
MIRIIFGLLISVSAIRAQEEPRLDQPLPIELNLKLAPAPFPLLQYSLYIDSRDRIKGNAATGYHRAMILMNESRLGIKDPKAENDRLIKQEEDLKKPRSKWPVADFQSEVERNPHILKEIEFAARYDHCDWDLDRRLERDGIQVLLPEVQKMRELAKLVRLKFRYELANNHLGEAWKALQTGLSMGRHVAAGPTLIQMLVGIAISTIMLQELEQFMQHPDAPNVYWALSTMPRDFMDLRRSMETELRSLEIMIPMLRELEKGPLTNEVASKMLDDAIVALRKLSGDNSADGPSFRFGAAAMVVMQYPSSRESLVKRGRNAADVEKMAPAQVVLLDAALSFNSIRDEMFCHMLLPYPQAKARLEQTEQRIVQLRQQSPAQIPTIMMSLILPATSRVAFAVARTDRRIEALKIVEAVRLHAYENKGKLPEKLEDIKLPFALDPLRGLPFNYRKVQEDQFEVFAPRPDGEREPIRTLALLYRVKIVK